MPSRRTKKRAVGHRPLGPHLQVVLPGVADATVNLDRILDHAPFAVTGSDLRHRSREPSAFVVLGDGQRGEVHRCTCALYREVVIRQLVLDRLEAADGYAELLALLRVFDGPVENRGASADRLCGDSQHTELDAVLNDVRSGFDALRGSVVEMNGGPRPSPVEGRCRFGPQLARLDDEQTVDGDDDDA